MVTDSKEKPPLITYGRYVKALNTVMVLAFVAWLVPFVSFSYFQNSEWSMTVLPFTPAAVFFVTVIIVSIVCSRKESVINKRSAKNVSSYLRDHYGIFADSNECAVYCKKRPVPYGEIINAEDLNSGEKIKITLRFSEDLRSVTPHKSDVPLQLLKNDEKVKI